MLYKYVCGLDLGMKQDFSAVGILEQKLKYARPNIEETMDGVVQVTVPEYQLRYLRRFELGTPYTEVINRVEKVMSHPEAHSNIMLIIDMTSLGIPIIEAIRQQGMPVTGVWIHGGTQTTQEGKDYRVPKRDLVSALAVLVESKRLSIAAGLEHAELLEREMLNFKAKISPSGHETYEAVTESVHDDLVIAVSLTAWYATMNEHRTLKYTVEAPFTGENDYSPLTWELE